MTSHFRGPIEGCSVGKRHASKTAADMERELAGGNARCRNHAIPPRLFACVMQGDGVDSQRAE